jgi:mono/diheme cytochrome c family protein
MKTVLKLLGLVVLLAAALVAFLYSGLYDVSAATPDAGLVRWALVTTQARSVARRSARIAVPRLDDPSRVRRGLVHYHEMCVVCHGAPGVAVSEIAEGMNPEPPELAGEGSGEPAEDFWIVKNGIKMTGMPSFGVTHDDEKIWDIVAFLQQLPKMSPEQYQAMVRAAGIQETTAPAHDDE